MVPFRFVQQTALDYCTTQPKIWLSKKAVPVMIMAKEWHLSNIIFLYSLRNPITHSWKLGTRNSYLSIFLEELEE